MKHPEKYREKRFHTMLERLCDNLLLGIEPRGKHATGFVAVTEAGNLTLDKNAKTAQDFIKTRKSLPERSRTVLLHTRYWTKGDPSVWQNNHPVFAGDFFTVHNGSISNDDELFEKYKFDRLGEVDSEIIPAMLNKYGLNEADKAFAELAGGFATASLNFRVPNTTVLSKGGTWPLHTLETKDILVFASTQKAIKDAWGAVLGTPPTRGWGELGSGDIWYIEGSRLTKKPKAFVYKGLRATSTWSGGAATWADDWEDYEGYEDWPYHANGNRQFIVDRNAATGGRRSRGAHTTLDNEQRMKELRATGKGACVTYSQRNTEKGKAYLEKYGNGRWCHCVHCKTSVSDTQVVKDTKDWGTICIDCFAIAKTIHPEKGGNLDEYLGRVGMRNDDFEQLAGFADTETYIHNQALYAIAKATGIKRTFIDWILHRADENVLSQSRQLTDLYTDLADQYFSKVMELWQSWSAESVEQPDPWVTCASGTHKQSEECEACKASEVEGAACGVEVFKADEKVLYDSEGLDTCLLCKRKPTFWLGITHAWCTRHKNKCAEKKCREVANGYTQDGLRWCHAHSRGKKGLIADDDFKSRQHHARNARAVGAI